jgi:hypothetical protein
MATEAVVVGYDPDPKRLGSSLSVVVVVEAPDKAVSGGWGDMSWVRK